MEGLVTYEEEALKEQIQQLKGSQEDFAVSSDRCPYFRIYTGEWFSDHCGDAGK